MPFFCASPHRASAFSAGLVLGLSLVIALWFPPLGAEVVLQPQVPMAPAPADPEDFIEGNYWALIIGISKYPTLGTDKQLPSARKDAEAVAKMLKERYGFSGKRMIELYDEAASRKGIIRACSSMKRRLTDKDSLFIYYAGHGEYESTGKTKSERERMEGMGYWIPADAELDDPASYIFNSQIRDYVANISARDIFLVVDSVFSSSLMGRTRGLGLCAKNCMERGERFVYQEKSRWVLASGDRYPQDKDGHSAFAWQFMKILEENTKHYLSAKDITGQMSVRMWKDNEYQMPQRSGPVIAAGDEGGQFVFRLLKKAQEPVPDAGESPIIEAMRRPFQAPKAKDLAPMVTIPAGEFIMGSKLGEGQPDESPQRTVYLDAYTIDKYEVTAAQYADYLKKSGAEPPDFWERVNPKEDGNKPVVGVDWLESNEYCEYYGKRLPTEAQWEKAARGTDGREYPWGNEDPNAQFANFASGIIAFSYRKSLAAVGSYEAGKSPYGVYYMVGNVWEWVNDWYRKDYYQVAPAKNPAGPDTGDLVVIRGGSWSKRLAVARSAGRMFLVPNTRSNSLGFRCAGEAR